MKDHPGERPADKRCPPHPQLTTRQCRAVSITWTFLETWLPRTLQLARRRTRRDGQHACSFSTFRMRKSVEKRQLLRSRVSRLGQLSCKDVMRTHTGIDQWLKCSLSQSFLGGLCVLRAVTSADYDICTKPLENDRHQSNNRKHKACHVISL